MKNKSHNNSMWGIIFGFVGLSSLTLLCWMLYGGLLDALEKLGSLWFLLGLGVVSPVLFGVGVIGVTLAIWRFRKRAMYR